MKCFSSIGVEYIFNWQMRQKENKALYVVFPQRSNLFTHKDKCVCVCVMDSNKTIFFFHTLSSEIIRSIVKHMNKLSSVLTPILYLEIQIKKLLLKMLPALHRKKVMFVFIAYVLLVINWSIISKYSIIRSSLTWHRWLVSEEMAWSLNLDHYGSLQSMSLVSQGHFA